MTHRWLKTLAVIAVLGTAILPTVSGIARAQGTLPTAIQMPTAISDQQYLTGSFALDRHLAGFDMPLASRGEFILSPSKGLVWQNLEPFPDTTIMTDQGIARKRDDGTYETIASGAQFHQFIALISAVLAGNWEPLSKQFTVTDKQTASDQTGADANSPEWQITLEPKNTNGLSEQISQITVMGAKFVTHVTLHKPSGDRDEITLTDQERHDFPMPDDLAKRFSGPHP